MGWVLLGFVLGAGAAIAALLHADFRTASPPDTSRLARLAPAHRAAPLIVAPVLAAPGPASPALIKPTASAQAKPAVIASPVDAKAPQMPKRASPTSDSAQVDEDAAATGMTGRASKDLPDLY